MQSITPRDLQGAIIPNVKLFFCLTPGFYRVRPECFAPNAEANQKRIMQFNEADPSEEPIVFNVEKCSNCCGTIEDEKNMEVHYFPGVYF